MERLYKVLPICLIVLGLVCPGCRPSSTAQLEENKAIVRRLSEAADKGDWATFSELLAPDYVSHGLGRGPLTREELVESYRMFLVTFADMHATIEDVIAEGDKVVTRYTVRCTHKGEFQGIPATGKELAWTGISIVRIAGGKIVEEWEEYDRMSLMQQLGAIPAGE